MLVSESCIKHLAGHANITFAGAPQTMEFDSNGNLPPL